MTALGSVLVAARGEIALRVIRSARALGLRTVAVFSDADRAAPHVEAADAALRIGPGPAAQSYASIPALLDAAARASADAVHPGYGFLSESAAFAEACAAAGLVFVGPPAAVMARVGRKDEARRVARAARVPVLPAVEEDGEGFAARAARDVGFPLMVKAAAGGGGRGMRIVRTPADLEAAVAAARREARAAFGDGTLLAERLVEGARHVEVQVLADAHGAVVHLGERDCTLQRRHQKVIEEAPAPAIAPALREQVTAAAVRLAREVGYVNAGTVEFLVAGEEAWLLEVNTRLQVEHPVTEAVCGIDLVELQLRVAAGEPIPFGQDDVRPTGHAIEARVYAEDPSAGFLPASGTATTVRWSPRVRVDHALRAGQEVTTHYDALLGKVVAHAPAREAARAALVAALDDTAILGLATNLGWLRDLAASQSFRESAIDTGWLDRRPAPPAPEPPDVVLCAAAWALADAAAGPPEDPWATGDGWRLGAPPAPVAVVLARDGDRTLARVDRVAGVVEVAGRRLPVRGPARVADGEPFAIEIAGERHGVLVERRARATAVAHHGHVFSFGAPDATAHEATAPSDGLVLAPMPGTVLAVAAGVGDAVSAGQTLVVLEAMKMELALSSPFDGRLAEVGVAPGEQVPLGRPLFRVAPADGS